MANATVSRETIDARCAEAKQALSNLRALARKAKVTPGQLRVAARTLNIRAANVTKLFEG